MHFSIQTLIANLEVFHSRTNLFVYRLCYHLHVMHLLNLITASALSIFANFLYLQTINF